MLELLLDVKNQAFLCAVHQMQRDSCTFVLTPSHSVESAKLGPWSPVSALAKKAVTYSSSVEQPAAFPSVY